MSIEAVVGRIDQILTMQQQLADPAGALQSSTASASAVPGATSTAATGTPASFSSALSSALAAGDSTTTGTTGDSAFATGTTGATGAVTPALATNATIPTAATTPTPAGALPPQVQAMVNMANSLVGKPYVYGGGHGSWAPQAGYDCSGFVSAVLHAGGFLTQPADTTSSRSRRGWSRGRVGT